MATGVGGLWRRPERRKRSKEGRVGVRKRSRRGDLEGTKRLKQGE